MGRKALILRFLASCFVCLLPPIAAAQNMPALYDVAGVSNNDVLNVRLAPNATSEVIGHFGPTQTGIEVVTLSDDQAWGRVNIAEGSGWASLRYLKRQPYQLGGRAPESATCYGTEPLWSLTVSPEDAIFATPDGLPLTFKRTQQLRSRNRMDRHMTVYENDLGGLVGTMRAVLCSDGMSDRAYGWELDLMLFVAGSDNAQMFSGCCSIAPPAN